ncbi:ATPase family AAA domain-containing protein [Vitis vinifera]|uniref:ATPase family AAA domain-containing protein n=1 Tax=Vitis vinifera TaxID=29760 RepID=A0A438GXC2_VITVI|nr:ATPase family AAA domain-containing protein [Vitis vinifera]
MYSKRSGQGDGSASGPVRTSDRLRRRPKMYGRSYLYYSPTIIRGKKSKTKTRTAASQIAKMLRPGNRPMRNSNSNSVATNLRRSTRKRRISVNLEGYTDSSGSEEDDDLMRPKYRPSRNRIDNSASQDELSSPKHKKILDARPLPRREGLRPRRSKAVAREQLNLESDDEQGTSEEKVGHDETENGNEVEDNDADADADDGEDEDEGDGDGDGEGEDDGEEDGDDEEGEEEQEEGRRRYDLRNRADVRRLSLEEGKQRPRSPRRVLHQGMGTKVSRDARKGGSRGHKRHRLARAEDSDDSLLVDELDQGPAIPWGRGGSRSAPPWLFGGLDVPGTSAWGLNVAASGWGHQSDAFATLTSGIQTAGPSSKGGLIFNLYRLMRVGVLLCGPPGTGKTLIARALACAASKAGQKVSFYMRKGADVLSKWVGEAERQLKLLFEEAQRNQPSIIFFDEIDGLAPVRSSKQEQIHNSIVSTLLALMDGLDSRGQVVLIGATNRIDAIDGALRRPGRFDREFNFPLPGCEARAEILEIHTRKWKQPPSKELKLELAASCVGYCGADLKALCTEAAIRAFREKYPQVYTSDDKFVIDVDSVKVEKYHFVEAMSTITPAAHRGSIVHSRPLSLVVAPCLQRHLQKAMNYISDIFPALAISSELTKLSMLSYGSAIPLVYRPRFLLYGSEDVGLDHLGPAILHELEKFPVHSLGFPALLSDPSAKTPEEALVHIFGEARRTTPSILYLPQFHLWWENAHEQLKAVLRTLLEELPSDFPILLLGTSSTPPSELETMGATSVFSHRNIYEVGKPSIEDRNLFFERLVEAALSVSSEGSKGKSQEQALPELPKAPKVASGPKVSELKAKVEAEQHALRRLRMCLRDVCNRLMMLKHNQVYMSQTLNPVKLKLDPGLSKPSFKSATCKLIYKREKKSRILYDKRFTVFHYPVMDEDAPNYRSIIQNPMDMATLLQRVDCGSILHVQYSCKILILLLTMRSENDGFNMSQGSSLAYNGDDYNGARIVSRAYELRDAVYGMLSQMDPALVAFCEKIAAQGVQAHMPDELGGSVFTPTPVVQMATVTRASARLRNVQPEVNLDQSYEALKRPKKNVDAAPSVSTAEDKPRQQEAAPSKSSQENEANEANDASPEQPECSLADNHRPETSQETSGHTSASGSQEDVIMSDVEILSQMESVKLLFVERTENYGIPQLERLYTRIMKGVFEAKDGGVGEDPKPSILKFC